MFSDIFADTGRAKRRRQLKAEAARKKRTSVYYDTERELTPAAARREADRISFKYENVHWVINNIIYIIHRISQGWR